jgi:hypothetical protein
MRRLDPGNRIAVKNGRINIIRLPPGKTRFDATGKTFGAQPPMH